MAKFRTNHSKTRGGGVSAIRVVGFLIAVCFIMFYLWNGLQKMEKGADAQNVDKELIIAEEQLNDGEKSFLPPSSTGAIVSHKFYTLSYDEDHEQAEWVAYKLTKNSLRLPNVPRAKKFLRDPAVQTQSAHHKDYSNSGYTRGHMAPAGDMAFSTEAMQESFYMSNMTPQLKECNGGIWRELEEATRDWAYDNDEIFIVTGPVLKDEHIVKKIGRANVSVSDLFYKVILDNHGSEKKAIAFLIPNEKSENPLSEYAVSIDKVEEVTGIDFFADYLDQEEEEKLEAMSVISNWRVDKNRYHQRVKNWNGR